MEKQVHIVLTQGFFYQHCSLVQSLMSMWTLSMPSKTKIMEGRWNTVKWEIWGQWAEMQSVLLGSGLSHWLRTAQLALNGRVPRRSRFTLWGFCRSVHLEVQVASVAGSIFVWFPVMYYLQPHLGRGFCSYPSNSNLALGILLCLIWRMILKRPSLQDRGTRVLFGTRYFEHVKLIPLFLLSICLWSLDLISSKS